MRLLFLGTPDFAVPTLCALAQAGHEIAAVVTQPDKPKGRGQQLGISPVKAEALERGYEVWQPVKLRAQESIERFRAYSADAWVVVGYGRIIPPVLLEIPPMGLMNVHASLLPKYRGAAPVQWAVANGERVTGVTTMRIDEGLDTGDILLQRETPIGEEETAVELWRRLAELGAELALETLEQLKAGQLTPRPQDDSQATYASIIRKEDGWIDWSLPAEVIANRCRGLVPWPGCYTSFRSQKLQIWKARANDLLSELPVAHMTADGKKPAVACGGGTGLLLEEVQVAGKKRTSGEAFLNGYRISAPEPLGEGGPPW